MFLSLVRELDQAPVALHAMPSRFNFVGNSILSAAASFAVFSQMQQVVGFVVESEMFELIDIMIRYGHNHDGIPALHYAIKMEDERAVKLLLEHGADPNAKAKDINRYQADFPEEKPLMAIEYAAVTGNMNIVRMLMEKGGKIKDYENYPTFLRFHFSPLRYAVINDHTEVVAYLISCGALGDGLFHDPDELSGVISITVRYGSVNVLQWLKKEGVNYKQHEAKNPNLLCIACQYNKLKVLGFLLREGLNPNRKDSEYDRTPLHFSAQMQNFECIELLIDYNADPNAIDRGGSSPLTATCNSNFKIVKALVDAGADVNHKSNNCTPLTGAIRVSTYNDEYMKTIEYLVSHGANVNAVDTQGRNALSYASQLKNYVLINWLIAHGAKD